MGGPEPAPFAPGRPPVPEVALGTAFGGAVFMVCVALGLGALLFPLHVELPTGVLAIFAVTPVLAGLALIGDRTPRVAGLALLAAFGLALGHLVAASRTNRFVDAAEVPEAGERPRRWWVPCSSRSSASSPSPSAPSWSPLVRKG